MSPDERAILVALSSTGRAVASGVEGAALRRRP